MSSNIFVPYPGSTEKNTASVQYFGVCQDNKCGKSTYNIRFGVIRYKFPLISVQDRRAPLEGLPKELQYDIISIVQLNTDVSEKDENQWIERNDILKRNHT